jgi:hypothetical protein
MQNDYLREIIFKILKEGKCIMELKHHLQSMKHRWTEYTAYLVRFMRRGQEGETIWFQEIPGYWLIAYCVASDL